MTARAIYILAILLLPSLAFAAATGLVLIPTADVLPPLSIDIGIASQYTDNSLQTAFESQIGLAKGLEAGYDIGWVNAPQPAGFNVKKVLLWRDDDAVLSLGLQNIGHNLTIQPYAVGRVPTYKGWFHAGIISIDSQVQPMLGYGRNLADDLELEADFIGGSENEGSIGLVYNRNNLYITAAYLRLNSGPNRNGVYLSANWIFNLQN